MSLKKFLIGTSVALIVFSTLQLWAQSAVQVEAKVSSQLKKEAVEYLSACGNFIRFDDENVYTGFGTYWTGNHQPRQPQPNILRFVPIQKLTEFQVDTLDSVIDVVKYKQLNYVLTYSGIEEWDLKNFKRLNQYKTHILNRPLGDEEHPQAFALYKNKLIIAHGRLGVSFFDLDTKQITRAYAVAQGQYPLQSVVKGISVSGRYAYAVLDSYTLVDQHEKPAFRGIAVIDMENENTVAELDGMDPGADSVISDDRVAIVSFYGQPLWKYSVSSLQSSKLPQPLKRVWKFPVEGHPTGKAAIDTENYYTCYSKMPEPGQGPYFIKVPMVLNRKVLFLD